MLNGVAAAFVEWEMKIKTENRSFESVMALPRAQHKKPMRPSFLLSTLVRLLGAADLRQTKFCYTSEGMDKVKNNPCLILMNHSSFIDLEIVSKIFYPRQYGIVCTSDGFVGKELLMRKLGCIPTQKFVSDVTLISDMEYMLRELNRSVLMYPEASYSFDGTATPLPRKMGILLKKLNVPVVMIRTEGAFARDPLYNCLQKRKVKVSAHVKCLLTPEEIKEKTVKELDNLLDEAFTFDNFRWQQENRIVIDEPFRADGLNRILYKCASCGTEGEMEGKGTHLICHHCGKEYELNRYGLLEGDSVAFPHIPDWYRWEREQLREEIENGTYSMDTDVKIGVMVDYKAIYMVGSGHLRHDLTGFHLEGCDGALNYYQPPQANYGLYSDYYWYEIGDMICIGNRDALYYCFPEKKDIAAKTRMAAEELYKIKKQKRAKV